MEKLLPDDLKATLPPLYSQERNKDPHVHVKFFTPCSNMTWYITEGGEEDGDFILFGYCFGQSGEWGYVSLAELESMGPLVERDLYFTPGPWSQVKAQHEQQHGGCYD